MKTWEKPEIEELKVNETEFHPSGNTEDGFYAGSIVGLANES